MARLTVRAHVLARELLNMPDYVLDMSMGQTEPEITTLLDVSHPDYVSFGKPAYYQDGNLDLQIHPEYNEWHKKQPKKKVIRFV